MSFLKKIIAYPLSIIYYCCFGLILVIFHPILWISFKLGGTKALRIAVDYLNLCLVRCLHILGTKVSFQNKYQLPKNEPIIFVSNHQSLNDVSSISWYLRKFNPKFVSKKELGNGIPSVSFNLRQGENVLIDRDNPKQALVALKKFGQFIEKKKFSAVLFPEGTRSKNGVPKRFSENGLKMLVKYSPTAVIVPITINNSWKIVKHGKFPLEIGVHLTLEIHKPIQTNDIKFAELFEKVEQTVKNAVIL